MAVFISSRVAPNISRPFSVWFAASMQRKTIFKALLLLCIHNAWQRPEGACARTNCCGQGLAGERSPRDRAQAKPTEPHKTTAASRCSSTHIARTNDRQEADHANVENQCSALRAPMITMTNRTVHPRHTNSGATSSSLWLLQRIPYQRKSHLQPLGPVQMPCSPQKDPRDLGKDWSRMHCGTATVAVIDR